MLEKIKKQILIINKYIATSSFIFLLVMPASTSYQLKDFGFGTGGTGNSSSNDYSLNAITGEMSAGQLSSAAYEIGSGLEFTNQSSAPIAPTFTNPSNYYNKLQLTINVSGNPSDTKFAIAISSDDFVTTNYVQSDNTVGSVLGVEDYKTYASWGGAGGTLVIGLIANTTYKVKVKAMQGKFTETGYGPIATAATVSPTLSFDIDVSNINTETDAPFSIAFGDLTAGAVTDSPQKIWVDFTTNGESGGKVFVIGQNGGLLSSAVSHRIDAVTGNLAALDQGFGAQGSTKAQTSGGPLEIAALYDQTGSTVGIADQSVRDMFTSSAPITGGRGSFLLKAKSSSITPSSNDYSEIFTVIASGNF